MVAPIHILRSVNGKYNFMEKKLLNLLLILVAVAAFAWCVLAKGLQWIIGFIPLIAAVYGLLGLNTDYVKHY